MQNAKLGSVNFAFCILHSLPNPRRITPCVTFVTIRQHLYYHLCNHKK